MPIYIIRVVRVNDVFQSSLPPPPPPLRRKKPALSQHDGELTTAQYIDEKVHKASLIVF